MRVIDRGRFGHCIDHESGFISAMPDAETARLLAAAPLLRAALVNLREWVRDPRPDDGARNEAVILAADAAIAQSSTVVVDAHHDMIL